MLFFFSYPWRCDSDRNEFLEDDDAIKASRPAGGLSGTRVPRGAELAGVAWQELAGGWANLQRFVAVVAVQVACGDVSCWSKKLCENEK